MSATGIRITQDQLVTTKTNMDPKQQTEQIAFFSQDGMPLDLENVLSAVDKLNARLDAAGIA
jgi:hypothetical protein